MIGDFNRQISYSKIAERNLHRLLDEAEMHETYRTGTRTTQQQHRRLPVRGKNNEALIQKTVYVADLLPEHTDQDVSRVFCKNYSLTKVTKQPSTTFAYVAFEKKESVKEVLKQAVFEINGHVIRVMPYNQPEIFPAEANLIIKNLEVYINEKNLINKFEKYGEIASCKVVRDHSGKSLCFAYLQFKTVESASRAIDELNNSYWEEDYDPDKQYLKHKSFRPRSNANEEIKGKKIYVGVFKKRDDYFKAKSEKEGRESNLYVKNLGHEFGDRDLYDLFKRFGSIKSAKIRRDKHDNRPLGCGFVDFEDPNDADRALSELDGYVLTNFGGRTITVKYASCKSRRQKRKEEEILQQNMSRNYNSANEEDTISNSGCSDYTTNSDDHRVPVVDNSGCTSDSSSISDLLVDYFINHAISTPSSEQDGLLGIFKEIHRYNPGGGSFYTHFPNSPSNDYYRRLQSDKEM